MQQRAETAEREAMRRQELLEEELYATDVSVAHHAWQDGDVRKACDILRRQLRVEATAQAASASPQVRKVRSPEAASTESHSTRDIRGWEWHYLWRSVTAAAIERRIGPKSIYFVCYSPDGGRLATAGADAVVRIHDATTLDELDSIETQQREVNGLAFSSDGKHLASAGDDGTIRIWDLNTGKQILRIQAHAGLAFMVRFTRNDRRLITCGKDPVVRVWDAVTGAPVGALEGHTDDVEAMSMSPNGRWLATASSDETVKTWDVETGQLVRTLGSLPSRANCVVFSRDDRFVAAGDVAGNVTVWQVADGRDIFSAKDLDGMQCLAWSRHGAWLTVGTRSGNLRDLQVLPPSSTQVIGPAANEADCTGSWQAHRGRVYQIAYSPQGDRVASVCGQGWLKLWRPRHVVPAVDRFAGSGARLVNVEVVPHSDDLLTVSHTHVAIFRRQSKEMSPLGTLPGEGFGVLAIAPGGTHFVIGNGRGQVLRGNVKKGLDDRPWDLGIEQAIWQMAFTSDGSRLLINVGRETIQVRDAHTGELQRSFPVEDCYQFALSPDDRWLAGSVLNDIVMWDLPGKGPPRRCTGHTSTIRALSFSRDGSLLASSSHDRRIKLWKCPEGRAVRTIEGSQKETEVLRFSLDGRTLFAANPTGPVVLWHVPTGRQLFELEMEAVHLCVGPHPDQLSGHNSDGDLWTCDLRGRGHGEWSATP